MKLLFYYSPLCPRCLMARKCLKSLLVNYPDIILDERDVLKDRDSFRQSGMKLIPALHCGDYRLNGVFLTAAKIKNFLNTLMAGDAR